MSSLFAEEIDVLQAARTLIIVDRRDECWDTSVLNKLYLDLYVQRQVGTESSGDSHSVARVYCQVGTRPTI